jgi:hypothetical protein
MKWYLLQPEKKTSDLDTFADEREVTIGMKDLISALSQMGFLVTVAWLVLLFGVV